MYIDRVEPLKILAVNDIYIFPRMLEFIIHERGIPISLDKASNGRIAVQKAKAEKYDAILMNLEMPVMNGWQATKAIRALDTTTPIIAWSAHKREHGFKVCMDDYAKIDMDHFLKEILDALERLGVGVGLGLVNSMG